MYYVDGEVYTERQYEELHDLGEIGDGEYVPPEEVSHRAFVAYTSNTDSANLMTDSQAVEYGLDWLLSHGWSLDDIVEHWPGTTEQLRDRLLAVAYQYVGADDLDADLAQIED